MRHRNDAREPGFIGASQAQCVDGIIAAPDAISVRDEAHPPNAITLALLHQLVDAAAVKAASVPRGTHPPRRREAMKLRVTGEIIVL